MDQKSIHAQERLCIRQEVEKKQSEQATSYQISRGWQGESQGESIIAEDRDDGGRQGVGGPAYMEE